MIIYPAKRRTIEKKKKNRLRKRTENQNEGAQANRLTRNIDKCFTGYKVFFCSLVRKQDEAKEGRKRQDGRK